MKYLLSALLIAICSTAIADQNFIDQGDMKRLWPINEKTQKIPKFKDRRTGYLIGISEQEINEANDKYSPDDRQVVIDTCREEAFRKTTQLVDKPRVAKRLKDPNDGLIEDLELKFNYCLSAMLKQWREEDEQEKKDSKR